MHVRRCAGEAKDPSQGLMVFYGVGNHGGGPTKKNLQSIRALDADSSYPHLEFSDCLLYTSREGYQALLGISRDARRLAAKSAADELTALTGMTTGTLEQAVAALPADLRPQPWTEEIW